MVTSDSARRSGGDAGAVSAFVDNGAVRLHALDNGRLNASPPVLVVPGMGEYADEYAWMLDRIGDRRVVIVDVRGRGASDAPPAGYAWEDHIGDLRAVVASLEVERPILVAFSVARRTPSATRSSIPAVSVASSSATTPRATSSCPRSSRSGSWSGRSAGFRSPGACLGTPCGPSAQRAVRCLSGTG